jgi:hypothetical protein
MRTVTHMSTVLNRAIYVLPLLADIGFALLIASGVGMAYGESITFGFLFWVLIFAFILDADNITHLVQGHIAAYKENPYDHRDGWHYPLVWLLGFLLVFLLFGIDMWTVSAALAVSTHFINDLFGTGFGVKLLWPFSSNNYKFFTQPTRADLSLSNAYVRYKADELINLIKTHGDPDWIRNYYLRISPLTLVEYGIFAVGILSCTYWILLY